MDHEGMVHALEEIHRLLRPGGYLIDIHPSIEGSRIEVHGVGRVLFSEPRRLSDDEDVVKAEEALAKVVERDLFDMEESRESDFLTYGSTVAELREYREEANAYDEAAPKDADLAREEELYAQAEGIMRASEERTQVASHSRVRMARLRPIR